MRCFHARTTIYRESQAKALAEALEGLDPAPSGTEILVRQEDAGQWEVGAFFPACPDPVSLALLSTALKAAEFSVKEIQDVDWIRSYRRETKPFSVGRFTVQGKFDEKKSKSADSKTIIVESSMAFGTGRHGSTKGCIEALEELAQRNFEPKKIADIGCGSGILSIAAARIWPSSRIVASDSDAFAVDVARSNLKFNRVEKQVSAFECPGLSHDEHLRASPYELILANILLPPLLDLVPRISELMAVGGHAVLSGVSPNESRPLREACASAGLVQASAGNSESWTTLVFEKWR